MLNRLNGWQRIGVVLSTLWLIVVGIFGVGGFFGLYPFGETIPASYKIVRTEAVCSKPAPEPAPSQKTFSFEEGFGCATGAMVTPPTERRFLISPARHDFYWWHFLPAVVIPVALFWSLSYGFVAVVKWVAKGFRRAT